MGRILVGRVLSSDTDSVRIIEFSSSATRTSVDESVDDTLLLAANPDRKGVIIQNESNSPLFVGYGTATVTAQDYTFVIPAQIPKEFAFGFTGMIRGKWQSASGGHARITELT